MDVEDEAFGHEGLGDLDGRRGAWGGPWLSTWGRGKQLHSWLGLRRGHYAPLAVCNC